MPPPPHTHIRTHTQHTHISTPHLQLLPRFGCKQVKKFDEHF